MSANWRNSAPLNALENTDEPPSAQHPCPEHARIFSKSAASSNRSMATCLIPRSHFCLATIQSASTLRSAPMSIKRRQQPSWRASMVASLQMTCAVLSMRNLFVGSTRRPLAHLIDIWKLLLRFGSCGKCFDNLRNRVPAIVIEKVRRESGWTSAGATPPPRRDLRCSSNCLRQLLDCARHRESRARILGVTRERIERFLQESGLGVWSLHLRGCRGAECGDPGASVRRHPLVNRRRRLRCCP